MPGSRARTEAAHDDLALWYAGHHAGLPVFTQTVQALLSVFLLAMWVLTQFGRPFQ
jgi:hypothetical protein